MNFDAFVQDVTRNGWNIHGVEVYADGELRHQYGDTTAHRYPIYSATKTVTSIAAGMAADEGRLDIARSVLDYLPRGAVRNLSAAQAGVYRHITLQRLMCMSVPGYPFRPEGESWLLEALHCPIDNANEREFNYSNISAYLVGVAVSCAVQEDLYAYLHRKLFVPLGIDQPPCTRCPDGYFYGASGMELTVHELSQIGLLLMNGGMYGGQRLLSQAYVTAAASVQQMNREGGYGYFLWKYRDGFSINGKWGQKCYILPAQNRMVTFLANMEGQTAQVRASMEKHLLDA